MKKLLKKLFTVVSILFILINIIAFFHAYRFTHFSLNKKIKTDNPENLDLEDKLRVLLLGVDNPKPKNKIYPQYEYKNVSISSRNGSVACWHISAKDKPNSTIALFHGYSGSKSDMLDRAEELLLIGYNVLLVDFRGSGDSEGVQTTLGYNEADDIKVVYDYLLEKGEKEVFLYGTSMGAVAIMKAIKDYGLNPKGILLECPFGTMYQTVSARFNNMNIPSFPMAGLLVFWGGIQNNFWAFNHNPIEYAEEISCPVLLMYGEQDENVSKEEISEIYENLQGYKMLKTYPLAKHESYIKEYKGQWLEDIKEFLSHHE